MTVHFADFDRIQVGDEIAEQKRFDESEVEAFARLSGDHNPLHTDDAFAIRAHFPGRVVHGMLSAVQVSAMIGMRLPGPGALWTEQRFNFLRPVFIGDEISFVLRVKHKSEGTRTLVVELDARNQRGEQVLSGEGKVTMLEPAEAGPAPAGEARKPIVLVTGASRGIGAAIARELSRRGFPVVINCKSSVQRAEQLAADLRSEGAQVIVARADVADPAAVQRMVAAVRSAWGRPVGILVNNASGPVNPKSLEALHYEDLDAHLSVQLRGAFVCTQAALPGMLEQGMGRIINIGSVVTQQPPPVGWLGYSVAKMALVGLSRSLATELGPKGIRVNLVSPGMTETDMLRDLSPRARKVAAMQIPLRRLGAPEDIARVVAMLCSEDADYIHGATINVSGGVVT
jgi:3-oxoacyl-[acyl-carrier protein] reductase